MIESGGECHAGNTFRVRSTRPYTSRAPFIEEARSHGELFIEQPYDLYTEENHEGVAAAVRANGSALERYANEHFQAVWRTCA